MESRIDLAKHFNNLRFRRGAEVGVADGRYSEILCKGINGLELSCIDLYAPYRDSWRTEKSQNKAYIDAKKRLKEYNVSFLVETSIKAIEHFEDGKLDFVFIDGGHTFDDVMLDIIIWSRKVKRGGIVSGHDYCFFTNSGVVEAVNKYTEINKIELNIIKRNNKNHRDDRQPCWWFVKK